jgi:uncharacterized protein (DUF2062 family)
MDMFSFSSTDNCRSSDNWNAYMENIAAVGGPPLQPMMVLAVIIGVLLCFLVTQWPT